MNFLRPLLKKSITSFFLGALFFLLLPMTVQAAYPASAGVFVTKFDASGNPVAAWDPNTNGQVVFGVGGEQASGIAVDAADNAYVGSNSTAGIFTAAGVRTAALSQAGAITAVSGGYYYSVNAFALTVSRYTLAGTLDWTRSIANDCCSTTGVVQVSLDSGANNVYVVGSGNISNGGHQQTRGIKFMPASNPGTNPAWETDYPTGTLYDYFGGSIAVDPTGTFVYVSGYAGRPSGNYDLFYVKLQASTGALAGGPYYSDSGSDDLEGHVVVDSGGYVYLVGGALTAAPYSMIIKKFDSSGNTVWGPFQVGQISSRSTGVALSGDGSRLYVTGQRCVNSGGAVVSCASGYVDGNMYVLSVNTATGAVAWITNNDFGGNEIGSVIVAGTTGIYVGGKAVPHTISDLRVDSVTASPASPSAGQAVTFSAVVHNYGQTTATNFDVRLRLDVGNNSSWDVTPPNQTVASLGGLATTTVSWTSGGGIPWTAVSGTTLAEVYADINNVVVESPPASAETNNSKTLTVSVPASFNYSLTNSDSVSGMNLLQGGSSAATITATLTSGVTQSVSYAVSGLPSGVTTVPAPPAACNPTCSSTPTFTAAAGATVGSYTVTITGNPLGRTTSFTLNVLDGRPTVSSSAATAVGTSSATLNANVTSQGGSSVTSRGVCYAVTGFPTSPCTSNGSGVGAFSAPVSSLSTNTIYYDRGFAANGSGTAYAPADDVFTTKPGMPGTPIFSAINTTTLTVSWTPPSGNGAITSYEIDRCANNGCTPALLTTVGGGTTSYNDTGLTAGTKYTYQIIPSNSSGAGTPSSASQFTAVQLTTNKSGTGTLTVTPADSGGNTTCPLNKCIYNYNTTVTDVTATPGVGYHFDSWAVCNFVQSGNHCQNLPMTVNRSVNATFVPNSYTLSVTTVGSGSVTSNPVGISCPGTCSAGYNYPTTVQLTATPGGGGVTWSGACSGTSLTCTVTMTADQNVTATFSFSNSAPTAVISGWPTSLVLGKTYALTAAGSTDAEDCPGADNGTANGGSGCFPGRYQWTVVTRPAGSTANFPALTYAQNFTPDKAGMYVIGLRVVDSNGLSSSLAQTVVVRTLPSWKEVPPT